MKFKFSLLLCFTSIIILKIQAQVINNSFITVNGNSQIEIPAKEITFRIEIQKTDTNAQNAYYELKQTEKKFIPLLKKFNITDSSITYSLSQLRQEGVYSNRPVQFQASENIMIKLKDFKQYEPFQLALLDIGVYNFHGSFSASNINEAKQKGYDKALDNAEAEANMICKKIGRELGKVLEVESRNRDYTESSPLQATNYQLPIERGLIDIPQKVILSTYVKIKYELK